MLATVNITRTTGAPTTARQGDDGIAGLVLGLPAGYPVAPNTTYEINSLKSAEANGFTAQDDDTHSVLAWFHLKQFFNYNPSGRIFVRPVAQGTTQADMLNVSNTHGLQLINDAGGKVRLLGSVLNPVLPYTPTIATEIDQDVIDAVVQAQNLAVEARSRNIPIHVIVEGRNFTGNVAGLYDASTASADSVSVVLAQDYAAMGLDSKHACTGALLGVLSSAPVHHSIAWPAQYQAQDLAAGMFVQAALGSAGIGSYTIQDLSDLDAKGYIFIRSIDLLAGLYWSSDPSCTNTDFRYVRYNRAVDKIIRGVYLDLITKTNQPLYVNADGTLQPVVLQDFENAGGRSAARALAEGEISGFDLYIDPDQNVLVEERIDIELAVTPVGAAASIQVTIGLNLPQVQEA